MCVCVCVCVCEGVCVRERERENLNSRVILAELVVVDAHRVQRELLPLRVSRRSRRLHHR